MGSHLGSGFHRCCHAQVIQLIEAHRWGVTALLAHNPAKMLRVAYELRSTKFRRDGCPSRDQQQRVLVRGATIRASASAIRSCFC